MSGSSAGYRWHSLRGDGRPYGSTQRGGLGQDHCCAARWGGDPCPDGPMADGVTHGHARCSCGWQSPHVDRPDAAQADAYRRDLWERHHADAHDAGTWPHPEATTADRHRGVARFLGAAELRAADTVPLGLRHGDVPLPPDGLDIGRHADGGYRTYQTCHPGSTLTSGHDTAGEAYWAAWYLRDAAAWDTACDVREARPHETADARWARERLARDADRVGKRFARWRTGPTSDPEAPDPPSKVIPVHGPGWRLDVAAVDRGRWNVLTPAGWSIVGYALRSEKKAREAVARYGPAADWTLLPWVIAALPGFRHEFEAIRAEIVLADPADPGHAERIAADHRALAAKAREGAGSR